MTKDSTTSIRGAKTGKPIPPIAYTKPGYIEDKSKTICPIPSFRASSMPRVMSCPASKYYEHSLPDTTNPDAERGTMLHALTLHPLAVRLGLTPSKKLETDYADAVTAIWEHPDVVTSADDFTDMAANELSTVFSKYGISKDSIELEQTRELTMTTPGDRLIRITGTADVVAIGDDTLIVADLKFGYRPVSAVANPQLLTYALLAKAMSARAGLTTNVVLMTIMPSIGKTFTWSASVDTYDNEVMKIFAAIDESLRVFELDDMESRLRFAHPTLHGCLYCKAKDECPVRARQLAEPLRDSGVPLEVDAIPQLKETLKWLEKTLETLEAEAKETLIMNPDAIPGVRLTTRKGTRFIDESDYTSLYADCEEIGPTAMDNIFEYKPKTITKLDKICKDNPRLAEAVSKVVQQKPDTLLLKYDI